MPKLLMRKSKCSIGIDPGKNGGLAVIGLDGTVLATLNLSTMTEQDVFKYLCTYKGVGSVTLEKVWARPWDKNTSAFTFGYNYGTVRALSIAAGLRVMPYAPQVWQKPFQFTKLPKTAANSQKKNRSKGVCQELFPDVHVTHATADAILLAEFGRRRLLKGL